MDSGVEQAGRYVSCVMLQSGREDEWGVADAGGGGGGGVEGKDSVVSVWGGEALCFKLFSDSASQWEYPKASHLPETPLAVQKEGVNEQGQTLPAKEEMLYLLFTNL